MTPYRVPDARARRMVKAAWDKPAPTKAELVRELHAWLPPTRRRHRICHRFVQHHAGEVACARCQYSALTHFTRDVLRLLRKRSPC